MLWTVLSSSESEAVLRLLRISEIVRLASARVVFAEPTISMVRRTSSRSSESEAVAEVMMFDAVRSFIMPA